MKTGRRSFLKGVLAVAIAPLAAITAPVKKLWSIGSIDLDQPPNWKNYTCSYNSNMVWPTDEELKAAIQNTSFPCKRIEVNTSTPEEQGLEVEWFHFKVKESWTQEELVNG